MSGIEGDFATRQEAEAAFRRTSPCYASTRRFDVLRADEYGRLDATGQVYLDYTGGGLHARRQLEEHMALLDRHVFGNPHSHNPTSLAMTELVESARAYVLTYFNAPPGEYEAVFTHNASGALKLVGEAYPFGPGSHYLLSFDNHNSVNGIREFARRGGAAVRYLPIYRTELRLDPQEVAAALKQREGSGPSLFAFPAQSNFSGVQHPLEMIAEARELGWDVLVDAAAYAPTNRLDLARWKPDFVPLSFYKMFGHPTGIGCLLARKDALRRLRRPWYAGGTISISSVQGDGHFLVPGAAGFEDGTVNYLNIPAVEMGLRYLEWVGVDAIHDRVLCLTGFLIEALTSMRHSSGKPLVRLHGPASTVARGATVTVSFFDRAGEMLDDQRIEELANHKGISLRTGCFCNPGAGEVAHGLTPDIMKAFFGGELARQRGDQPMSFQELRSEMRARFGRDVSAVRVSLGIASNFADVDAFLRFAAGLLDRSAEEIGRCQRCAEPQALAPDGA
jgi:selenocysteine lyase/cysteine desulfurase